MRATIGFVGAAAEQAARVPAANIHVSRAAFGQVWAYAHDLATRPGPDNRYLVGVLWTYRWLADQPVWSRVLNKLEIPASPVTGRHYAAMPETIEVESLATARAYRPGQTGRWVGLARGTLATLEWAWHGSGRLPLELPAAVE